jgi:threonine aldolase
MIGGGMRQSGVIAAAGIFALENMINRLAEDHANARRLAERLEDLPGLLLEGVPESNILFYRLKDSQPSIFLSALERSGVRALELEKGRIRMVTHYGITAEDIDDAGEAVRRALRE